MGFKISNIVQIDDCSTIDITMTSTKNIVEFSNYQKVKYNGVEYDAGNHSIENTKNATFTFEDIASGTIISPIIIYVEKIENTSCPLVISHKKGDTVVEEVKLTLSATFYSNEPSDIVNNKENTSGSLTQEDVIISRPKEEKPPENSEVKPPQDNEDNDGNNGNNDNNGNNNNNNNNDNTGNETDTPQRPNDGNDNQNQGQTDNDQQPEEQEPPQSDTEVQLPIIDEEATADKEENANNQSQSNPTLPNDDIDTPPSDDEENNKSFLDFINNIDKKILIIAIACVLAILIIVIILIIIFSKPKNKEKANEQLVPPQPTETMEQIEPPINEQPTFTENPFMGQPIEQTDNMIVEEPENEFSPTPVFEETVNTESFEETDVSNTNTDESINETTVEDIMSVEEVITETKTDEYETILNLTIPKEELEKLKNDFNDVQSIDDSENEYSNIIQ